MSTRYDLSRPEEDAYATDIRSGKEVWLHQQIPGTDYWIAEEITNDFWDNSEYTPYIIVCDYELADINHY